MVQERSPAEVLVEAKTEQTRQLVHRARRVVRREFTAEGEVRIVLDGFRGELRVSDPCRGESISRLWRAGWDSNPRLPD